ncbi:Alpha-L-fucosidase 2 [Acorus gramineus]|uniref:Alpha-L-fucosidase 2 n=1 Tax=Acorus gramineus TaxID=55184 RepID=A0AAV8ZZP1_ACOGR|nr:Alpha-L-fucosidase 2 [Acorus gramineus]
MDMSIIEEVFTVLVSTSEAKDFEDPDVHHRHLSHLYGFFPRHSITVEKVPELCRAADYSLYKREQMLYDMHNGMDIVDGFCRNLIWIIFGELKTL